MKNDDTQYRCIGRGFCGSVWSLKDETDQRAIKREDGGPGRSITNDYNMHLRILQSHLQHALLAPLSIPHCYALVEPSDQPWWNQHLSKFPAGFSACRALISERIPKVPRSISDKVVDVFCAGNKTLSDFVKNNVDDEACLIRPYLGRRRRRTATNTSRLQRFSLRNVPLHLDQMETLNLDVRAYARTIADALAMMHWGAGVDANDVEFVLAPPRVIDPSLPHFQSQFLGDHSVWIFDFDCCRLMSMDEAGVEQACAAFYGNDPFYPRPCGNNPADSALWVEFKDRFLLTSQSILGENSPHRSLPQKLMSKIEEEGTIRELRRSGQAE